MERRAKVSGEMSQAKSAAVAIAALVVGLLVGLFIPHGQVAPANTITTTVTTTAGVPLTETITVTAAVTETPTKTLVEKVLITFKGSGIDQSQPFTATSSSVKVTLRIVATTDDLEYVGCGWYIYEFGKKPLEDPFVTMAEVKGEEGNFDFYRYDLLVGRKYYLYILPANCKYEITIEETKPP